METRYPDELIRDLEAKAKLFRRQIIISISKAGSGHPAGSLSVIDILTALYFHMLRHDPKNPSWEDRDRLFLSKGHACAALYACLAHAGYFEEEILWTFRELGSPLQGHPDMLRLPGLEMPGGSLGQGFSMANGAAMAGKIDDKDYRVFVILGDGEINEGAIWEATMTAAHYKLDNLTAILDKNGTQLDGLTHEIMNTDPVADKWRAFNWQVYEIDGHDFRQILWALEPERIAKGKPTFIVANTVKGKGVSFMEGTAEFHGKAPDAEQTRIALEELA